VPRSINPGHRVGRGVPDVAGNASPVTGYKVRVDGRNMVVGGTSAVAPLWAGLVALLNQDLGRPVGFLNPVLYHKVLDGGGLFDVLKGDNDLRRIGGYAADDGWDACTGLGAPLGKAILNLLR
jgi:kumamolisin